MPRSLLRGCLLFLSSAVLCVFARGTSFFSRPFVTLSSRPACTCPQAGPRSPRGTAQYHSCSWFVPYFISFSWQEDESV